RIGNVDEDVHEEHGERGDDHGGLDDGEIPKRDGVNHDLADAGEAEDRFHDDGTVDDAGRLIAGDGDDRKQRVAHGMAEQDRAPRYALGAGGLDVGRRKHAEHRAAHDLHDDAKRTDDQHRDGQNPVQHAPGSGGGQPAQ